MDLIIQRSHDWAHLDGLIVRLRRLVTTDQYPADESTATLLGMDGVYFIEAVVDGARSGGFLVIPTIDGASMHSLLTPPARGGVALRAIKLGLRWVWEHTELQALIAAIRSDRPEVLIFAKLCGFQHYLTEDLGCTVGGKRATTKFLRIERPQKKEAHG